MSSFVKASGGITPNSADPGEEFPFLHTITVVDRVVSVDKPELVQNNIKTETVTLNLDSEWEGLSTVINIGNERPVPVIWSGEPVVIPAELMTTVGSLDVSVVGYGNDGGIRAVTKQAQSIFNVVASGFVEDDEAVPDPTTILGQLIQAADNANQAADRFNQASEGIEGIGPAIEKVQASEANAKQSETNAASSAESASQSASTSSTSAEAARTSETNAAASATAAQQAVDGFGLEVGTTTTGEPGTDAAVEIQKTGTKYTANFTIPRGDVGPAGVNENVPLGTASGIVARATDAYPALPRKVQVHGHTVENLWPEVNASSNGITVSVDSGVINVTGTASARVAIPSVVGSLSPGDKITISVNKTDSNVTFDLYAYKSGSYVSSIAGINGIASDSGEIPADGFDEIRAYVIVEQGVTVDWSGMVMLVKGDTVPDVFVPSGVHTVEPTKLVAAGKNIYDESYAELTPYWGRGEFDENGDLLIYSNSDVINGYSAFRIVSQEFQLPEGDYVISASIPNIPNTELNVYDESNKNAIVSSHNAYPSPTTIKVKIEPDTICTINVVFSNGTGTTEAVKVSDIQIERGAVQTSYSKPETVFVGLPADISLADGDTLSIDRDGTAQIFDFAGSGTKLENVSLPELPAPTFNVYTTGGYIRPTVKVDYEQDVNLVLQALEAKIAALEVANETNQ